MLCHFEPKLYARAQLPMVALVLLSALACSGDPARSSDEGDEPRGGSGGRAGNSATGASGGDGDDTSSNPPAPPAIPDDAVYGPVQQPRAIAVDDELVYVAMGYTPGDDNATPGLWYGPKDGSRELTRLSAETAVADVVIAGQHVVYRASGGFFSVPLGGGTPTKIAFGDLTLADDLTTNGVDVFIAETSSSCDVSESEDRIYSVNVPAARATAFVFNVPCLQTFTVDATHVYMAVGGPPETLGHIARVPFAGGEPEIILANVDTRPGHGIAVHDGYVFFGIEDTEGALAYGSLYRVQVDGGQAERLGALDIYSDVKTGGDRLYQLKRRQLFAWSGEAFAEDPAFAAMGVLDIAADNQYVYFVSTAGSAESGYVGRFEP